jgi:TBC1 domain family member 10
VRSYKEEIITIVKKDVPRTFSSNPFFNEKIEEVEVGREMLYKTCKAIATYFPDVGYCQGLNFLVGFLLQISGGLELEVVNAVINLYTDNRFLALGIYDDMFPIVQCLKKFFWKCLNSKDKKLANHIKDTGLPDDTWLTKWFISLFTGYFTPYFSARFLDFIFSTDIFMVPVLSVAIILSLKNKVLAMDMEGINSLLHKFVRLDDPKFKDLLPEPEILIK